jgi:transportin-3
LVDFIPQLHVFYLNVVKTLPFRDILEVTEAVSHVMTVIPVTEVQKALQLFCLPIAQELLALVSKGKDAISQEECVKIGDILEQISVFFEVIQPQVEVGQPHPCVTFIGELWPVLDITLSNFGDVQTITEPLCKCFNSFILSYGPHFVPLLPQLMERLVNAFGATGQSCYLWVSYKLIREYACDEGDAAAPCFELVQRLSQSMFMKLQQQVNDSPDVVEEYFRMMSAYLDKAPKLLVQDPSLSTVFQAGIVGLSITEPRALEAILTFYRRLLDLKQQPILALYIEFGGQLTAVLFTGLVDFYRQDSIPDVAALLKTLAEVLPNESAQWMLNTVNNVPEEYMSIEIKNEFMTNWTG